MTPQPRRIEGWRPRRRDCLSIVVVSAIRVVNSLRIATFLRSSPIWVVRLVGGDPPPYRQGTHPTPTPSRPHGLPDARLSDRATARITGHGIDGLRFQSSVVHRRTRPVRSWSGTSRRFSTLLEGPRSHSKALPLGRGDKIQSGQYVPPFTINL